MINDNLHGVELQIGKNGRATLVENGATGPASPEQRALAEALSFAIDRKQAVAIGVTSASPDVMIGNYGMRAIDVADIAALGSGPGASSAGAIAHEVAEQTINQVYGLQNDTGEDRIAHRVALTFQAAATGFTRHSVNSDDRNFRTLAGATVSYLRRGSEKLTGTLIWFNGDLVRVERK